jgi:hypothetical protein
MRTGIVPPKARREAAKAERQQAAKRKAEAKKAAKAENYRDVTAGGGWLHKLEDGSVTANCTRR